MPHVLIVDDEPAIGAMVMDYLVAHGHRCDWVANSNEARHRLEASLPDVLLLDWMLPGRSGYEFARILRSDGRTKQLPIIMLTARGEEGDKVKALDAGADDYITKPFSLAELLARVNALVRRTSGEDEDTTVEVAGLCIDDKTRRVWAVEHSIEMGPTEFALLYFLMTHRERVFSRAELIQYVWGPRAVVEERTVDVHIRRVRKHLTPSGHHRLLQTVRGSGYRLSTR